MDAIIERQFSSLVLRRLVEHNESAEPDFRVSTALTAEVDRFFEMTKLPLTSPVEVVLGALVGYLAAKRENT
jgi:hypothetical protein